MRGRRWRDRGALTLAIVAVAVVGTALASNPRTRPAATAARPSEAVHATPLATALGPRLVRVVEPGFTVDVPAPWGLISHAGPAIVGFEGNDPVGSMSVFRGRPEIIALCDPDCRWSNVRGGATPVGGSTIDDVAGAVERLVGRGAWRPMAGLDPSIGDARVLSAQRSGPSTVQSYMIGSYGGDLMVAAVTLPDRPESARLAERILQGIHPTPSGNVEFIGDLEPFMDMERGLQLLRPTIWPPDRTPSADMGAPADRTFGAGRMSVSTQGADGALHACDPTCRSVDAADLATLERATFASAGPDVFAMDAVVAGMPGRVQVVSNDLGPAQVRAIVVDHDVRIHVWIDLSRDTLDPMLGLRIVQSLTYLDPGIAARDGNTLRGRGYELDLPSLWQGEPNESPGRTIQVTAGDDTGHIWVCGWSGLGSTTIPCSIRHAVTVEQLAGAVAAGGSAKQVVLGGEPGYVVLIEAPEYPARGGQWLGYIVAFHDGRPIVIRLHNRSSPALGVEDVVAGFRFTD